MNITINFGEQQKNTALPGKSGIPSDEKKAGELKKSLFAGNMNINNDPVSQKLEEARKKAYKIVSDAFGADKDFEKQLHELKDFAREKRDEKTVAQADRKRAEETIAALKDEYKVDPDSKEQKDLEWLIDYRKRSLEEGLSDIGQMKKDRARAEEIEANLTEYQSCMLEANEQLDHAVDRIKTAEESMVGTRQALTDAKTEKNKTHTMVDAQKEADEIMDAAERAVIGMVMNDAKDKLDEKLREEQEKAEEKKEEEEEQEKIEAEREAKKEIQEALAEGNQEAAREAEERVRQHENDDLDLRDVLDSDSLTVFEKTGNVNAALDDLKNKMALVDADLMGLKVDESV